jgi:hypothetical protein
MKFQFQTTSCFLKLYDTSRFTRLLQFKWLADHLKDEPMP